MELLDRVAVVTGGGSGIGKATALLLAKAGAKVALVDRTLAHGQATVRDITEIAGTGIALEANVADADQMARAFKQIEAEYQRIDILFINAGINGVWAPIEDIELQEWDETIEVNLRGTFLAAKYAIPYLKKQGGVIIVNSSINGTRRFNKPGATAYACSKAAQVAFTKMLAAELATHQIRVNVICPGRVETEIESSATHRNLDRISESASIHEKIPLTGDRPGSAEQIAQLVLFLASDAASFISGTEVWIDGGSTLA
jgi:NAD(P)-dependent dehydrogenase (short-subunit alcohol dehydrogenase family)